MQPVVVVVVVVVVVGKKREKNCTTKTFVQVDTVASWLVEAEFLVVLWGIGEMQCMVAGSEYGARGGTKMCTGAASPFKFVACRLQHVDIHHRPQQFIQQFGSQALMIGKLLKRRPWHKKCLDLILAMHHSLLTMQGFVMQVESLRALGLAIQAQFLLWAVNFV